MTRPALLLLALVALFSRSLSAQDFPSGNCPCTLKGVVLNAVTGAPIRNALVESSAGISSSILTDSDGAFRFESLPTGSATLLASKPGFLPPVPFLGQPASFRVAPDAPDVVLKLVPGGVVRGRVTDDRGLPLENISVKLFRRPLGSSAAAFEQAGFVQTNDLGVFRITDLPSGAYYLLIDPSGTSFHFADNGAPVGFPRLYYPGVPDVGAATPIKISAGREAIADLSLTSVPYVRIFGKITGAPQGVPVQAGLLSFGDPDNPISLEVDPQTGSFHSDWIAPGSYSLSAAATQGEARSGFSRDLTAHQSVLALSEVTGLNVALQLGASIPIHVSGLPSKTSLNNLALTAKSTFGQEDSATPSDQNNPAQATADMWFESLPQGTYHIAIAAPVLESAENYFVESAKFGSTDLLASDFVVDSSASSRSIDIVFQKGAASVSGTVNLKGAAQPAIVCLIPEKFGAKPLFNSTSNFGGFVFQYLAPGPYRIIAVDGFSNADFQSPEGLKKLASSATSISLSPAQNLEITLDLTSVKE